MADPSLSENERSSLVRDLMTARRAVAAARRSADDDAVAEAHAAVDRAKHALGERGPAWWNDGAPALNRHMARTTPYAGWFEGLSDVEKRSGSEGTTAIRRSAARAAKR